MLAVCEAEPRCRRDRRVRLRKAALGNPCAALQRRQDGGGGSVPSLPPTRPGLSPLLPAPSTCCAARGDAAEQPPDGAPGEAGNKREPGAGPARGTAPRALRAGPVAPEPPPAAAAAAPGPLPAPGGRRPHCAPRRGCPRLAPMNALIIGDPAPARYSRQVSPPDVPALGDARAAGPNCQPGAVLSTPVFGSPLRNRNC